MDTQNSRGVHQHTDPNKYDPEFVERIKNAVRRSFAEWNVDLPKLRISDICQLAEHTYAVRFHYCFWENGELTSQDEGIYVDYAPFMLLVNETKQLSHFAHDMQKVNERL